MTSGALRRLDGADWLAIAAAIDADGFATLPKILDAEDCDALVALYSDAERFRSRVVMERHGFGLGEYQYFANPLPPLVATLRTSLYRHLAPLANDWNRRLGIAADYPAELAEYLAECHAAGQSRPTPLLLRYETGGFNCLHQDRYGELAFPLQATALLSRPGSDFSGGEFLLVEQRLRAQSRGMVVPLGQGDLVLFPNAVRPVQGTRGDYRVTMRHGVSRITAGRRWTLGVIFHDAA